MPAPFYRMGEPFRIPVSTTSAATQFAITLPKGATSFLFINPNLFSVRLRGTKAGNTFTAVTATTGWLILPGVMGPFGTLTPAFVSAMSVDGPSTGYLPAAAAGSGFIELQYGTGGA